MVDFTPVPVGNDIQVNTYTTNSQQFPSLTALDGGGFVITWTSIAQDGSDWGIYGQRYTAAGVADGGEFRINTYTSNGQIFSSVTALDGGGFVVTWQSFLQDSSLDGVYGQRYTAAGVADGVEFRINTYTNNSQAFSSVTALDGGGFVVTWSSVSQDGSGWGSYGQRYTAAGVADGAEFRVNTYLSSDQIYGLR